MTRRAVPRRRVDRSPIGTDGRATYTVPEVAALLGANRNTIYEAAARGEIPGCIRLGRKVVFARAAVLAWLGQGASSEE